MFVEKVIAEGFKSYAERTEVSGFHPHFNAITGLNGSGKSNILDSICFVLGITNLAQVRATKLQDLIYKQGQASVTKASVTVCFNNSDKSRSPVGYENHDKIQVTRIIEVNKEGKYLINGKIAKRHAVSQLFHSVQLNVNNPHFLIMQGRVTKVLTMKPVEILSMVEEAAGTKMYENNKNEALKQIEKKEAKLAEINYLLLNEIGPALNKLRSERSSYIAFKKLEKEYEILQRFEVAKAYFSKEHFLVGSTDKKRELEKVHGELSEKKSKLEEKHVLLHSRLRQISDHSTSAEQANDLLALENEVNHLSKRYMKYKTSCENLTASIRKENSRQQQLISAKEEISRALVEKQRALIKSEGSLENQRIISHECSIAAKRLENKLESLRTGVVVGEADQASLSDQLNEHQHVLQQTATERKQLCVRLNNIKKTLLQKQGIAAEAEKELSSIREKISSAEKEVRRLESERTRSISKEELVKRLLALQQKKEERESVVSQLQESLDSLSTQLGALHFTYTPPSATFDHLCVKGMVARLIHVPSSTYCTALEVAAGGRLYHVVVDTQHAAAQLLARGNLKRRVTIIPLDKIAVKTITDDSLERAKRAGGSQNVAAALSLIEYEKKLKKAMEFVFGGTVVCTDQEAARRVTFAKNVNLRSVTLEGDLYEPTGTLTGGANLTKTPILRSLQKLTHVERNLEDALRALSSVKEEIAAVNQKEVELEHIQQALALNDHELKLLQETLACNPFHQQLQELESLNKEEAIFAEKVRVSVEKEEEIKRKCIILEEEINNFKTSKTDHLNYLEGQLCSAREKAKENVAVLKKLQNKVAETKFEIEEMLKEEQLLEEQSRVIDSNIQTLSRDLENAQQSLADLENKHGKAKERLKEEKQKMHATCSEKTKLEEDISHLENLLADCKVELKTAINNKNRLDTQILETREELKALERKYSWIVDERNNFGIHGGPYDFANRRFDNISKQLESCEKKLNALKYNLNSKVITRFEEVEAENNALLKKKSIVEKDRETIYESIKDLDAKKNETLEETYKEVDKHFGSIFSTLLPGTQARLVPVSDKHLLEGLEVKVAFGSQWKESLSELSGGQRSLVALSLILALLRYKPAPMYILDEVDSALDLSHTQNIGRMLKTHFSDSQFIVVSLKEGMFNNANVLFKTAFVNGMSTVTRICNSSYLPEERTKINF
ncbi:structural maintenance of chromosomes protein 2-like isoform X2 [Zophobas morio]|uniref:structural maintenance of chromosomes protein 2-like isoform X2 n=1 Tax=Zophobas morio TaxID=2755281 RepID=UPI003082D038